MNSYLFILIERVLSNHMALPYGPRHNHTNNLCVCDVWKDTSFRDKGRGGRERRGVSYGGMIGHITLTYCGEYNTSRRVTLLHKALLLFSDNC